MAEQRRSDGPQRTGGSRKPTGKTPSGSTKVAQQPTKDLSTKSVAELREALSKRLIDPLGLVMLSRERIEEALGDAVSRGRVTADDAQDLAASLLERGRKQTNDLLGDLEQLLGRKARRAAGIGTDFPIAGYEDLTAAEVAGRLDGLSAAELREVRDHERRHANRKTVLSAIAARLA